MQVSLVSFWLCWVLVSSTCPSGASDYPCTSLKSDASKYTACRAALMLQNAYYDNQTNIWENQGWWNTANSVESMQNFIDNSNINAWQKMIENTNNIYGRHIGEYFDDVQWWSLANIRLFERFLHFVSHISRVCKKKI